MSTLISPKLAAFKPYQAEAAFDGIHLDANESFAPLPDALREKIARRVRQMDYRRYPDARSSDVCTAFARLRGVDPACVTAGNGSDELISILLQSFLQKGDRVLLTDPDFSMYKIYCQLAEVTPVVLEKGEDLALNPQAVISLANREKVKMILFSNPCNPTGQGLDAHQVMRIVQGVDCLVVVDEAYMPFWDQSVLNQAPGMENLIVLQTLSKVGFAAARLGFAVANKKLTAYLHAAKSPYNVNALTQAAGEVLLEETDYLNAAVAQILASRSALYQALMELGGRHPGRLRVFPSQANFVTVDMGARAAGIHAQLKQSGISVRLVDQRYFRITAGAPQENAALMEALERILQNTGGEEACGKP